MSAIDMTLGDQLTLKQLSHALRNGFSPIVEVESMDGIYKVRFHHANGVSDLSDNKGHVSTFLGTGEIRDACHIQCDQAPEHDAGSFFL